MADARRYYGLYLPCLEDDVGTLRRARMLYELRAASYLNAGPREDARACQAADPIAHRHQCAVCEARDQWLYLCGAPLAVYWSARDASAMCLVDQEYNGSYGACGEAKAAAERMCYTPIAYGYLRARRR